MAGLVCENCGTSNPAGRQFCENCDGFLDWDSTAEAEQAQPAAPPKPAQPPPGPPPPQQQAPPPPHPDPAAAAAPPPPRPTMPGPTAQPYPGQPYTGPSYTAPTYGAPTYASAVTTAPMERVCQNCGTASDMTKRFCRRCGTWLVTPTLVAPAPPDPLGTRLRRRWWGGTTGAYSGDLTRSTIAFRVLSIVIIIALVGVVLTVAGWHPIRRVTDLAGHVLGSGRVSGVTAQAVPADVLPGHPAAWVVDDVRGRG